MFIFYIFWGAVSAMKLLVIRHGESEADLLDVYEGRADFPLTERGHRQAEAMSVFVKKNFDVSAVYCSPLKRAFQTAVHLAEATAAPLVVEEKLMEFNNGLIAGLERRVADEKYPMVSALPVHDSVYEQESALEFRFRADYILSRIISQTAAEDTAAIVTHGGVINQLYRSFLRLPIDSDIFFETGNTGIHCWCLDDAHRRVMMANYTAHAEGV